MRGSQSGRAPSATPPTGSGADPVSPCVAMPAAVHREGAHPAESAPGPAARMTRRAGCVAAMLTNGAGPAEAMGGAVAPVPALRRTGRPCSGGTPSAAAVSALISLVSRRPCARTTGTGTAGETSRSARVPSDQYGNGRTACTADRAPCAVSVVGPKKGVVTRTVATNADVPNPAADERSGGVLVVNRTGATGTRSTRAGAPPRTP